MGKVHVHEQRGAIKHAREVEGKEAGISMVMWTDGSCLSDGSTAAAVVYKMPHSRTQYVDVYEREELKPRRSIEAEMLALMAALATVVEMLGKGVGGALHGMGIGQVEVLTDSTSSLSLIEHDVEGAWRMFRDRGLAGVEGEEDDPEGGGGDAERHVYFTLVSNLSLSFIAIGEAQGASCLSHRLTNTTHTLHLVYHTTQNTAHIGQSRRTTFPLIISSSHP